MKLFYWLSHRILSTILSSSYLSYLIYCTHLSPLVNTQHSLMQQCTRWFIYRIFIDWMMDKSHHLMCLLNNIYNKRREGKKINFHTSFCIELNPNCNKLKNQTINQNISFINCHKSRRVYEEKNVQNICTYIIVKQKTFLRSNRSGKSSFLFSICVQHLSTILKTSWIIQNYLLSTRKTLLCTK